MIIWDFLDGKEGSEERLTNAQKYFDDKYGYGDTPDGIGYDTKYVMYWAEEEILTMMAAKLAMGSIDSLLPLPPASTIILEFYEEPYPIYWWDSISVRMYINDQYVPMKYCSWDGDDKDIDCDGEIFMEMLSMDILLYDVYGFCHDPPNEKEK